MRISDWSSDVCSSDLQVADQRGLAGAEKAGDHGGGNFADRGVLREGHGSAPVVACAVTECRRRPRRLPQLLTTRHRHTPSDGPAPTVLMAGLRACGSSRIARLPGSPAGDRKSTRLKSSNSCAFRIPPFSSKKKQNER